MSKKFDIKDKDYGFSKITSELEKFKNSYVKVGILSSNNDVVDGVPVVEYATYNENGVHNKKKGWRIPPRPFVKGYADSHKNDIEKYIQELIKAVSKKDGMKASEALKSLGVYGRGGMQKHLLENNWTPNSPKTIKQKKSSRPLFDTGRMVRAIQYEIKGL